MNPYTICTADPSDPETATCTLTKLPCGTVHFETEQDGQLTLERVEKIWVEAEDDSLLLECADESIFDFMGLGTQFLKEAAQHFPLSEAPEPTSFELIHTWAEDEDAEPSAMLIRKANQLIYQLRTPDGHDWLKLQAFEHTTAGGTFYTALTASGQVVRLT